MNEQSMLTRREEYQWNVRREKEKSTAELSWKLESFELSLDARAIRREWTIAAPPQLTVGAELFNYEFQYCEVFNSR